MRFDDINAVYEMEKRLFPNPWPRHFFENDLKSHHTVAFVAEDNQQAIGYAIASCIDVEFHITNIAVDETHQRQGVARTIMRELENIANERGCISAYLEVRTHNIAAIKLYEKLGYKIIYCRKQYYIDGDDAYVMHKALG